MTKIKSNKRFEKAIDDFLDRLFVLLEKAGIKTDNWDGDEAIEEIVANGITG